MRYRDGRLVNLGDIVIIDGQHSGKVVANIGNNEYSINYPKENWCYLQTGALIDTSFGGVIHYQNNDSIELVSRGT